MAKEDINSKEFHVIDVQHIFKTVWKRLWAIVLVGVICAGIGFGSAKFVVPPKYRARIMMYVNNSDISVGASNFSISSSEITAAQSLVKTYGIILNNKTTLDEVIKAERLSYNYKELSSMIKSYAVNDTEVMAVEVVSKNPKEAVNIANRIGDVLLDRISEVMTGSKVVIIDWADPNPQKVSPSATNYTLIGFLLGIVVSLLVVIIMAVLDDTIHDEEYLLKNYEYPILAKVPDLYEHSSSKDYYYRSSKKDGGK